MFLIHTALGEDSKIFDIDEAPTPAGLFNRLQQNPDTLEAESFYTKALREYSMIEKEYPELIENLKTYPRRIKTAKGYDDNELMVFFKKQRLYISVAKTDTEKVQPYQSTFEDVFEKIVCTPEEKPLDWNTQQFWQTYQSIKDFRDFRPGPINEQNLEIKARNNLEFLIRSTVAELMPYKDFLRTLREDILDYGTLADYTLRRIGNFKETSVKDIQKLKNELGGGYLIKEKNRQKDQKKEIIIAIENKRL
jgi:hypothetical protein